MIEAVCEPEALELLNCTDPPLVLAKYKVYAVEDEVAGESKWIIETKPCTLAVPEYKTPKPLFADKLVEFL